MTYAIVEIHETEQVYSGDDCIIYRDIKVNYETDTLDTFNKQLGTMLLRSSIGKKILIVHIDQPIDVKLIGLRQIYLFPLYELQWYEYGIRYIFCNAKNDQSSHLLVKTLLSIDGVKDYLKLKKQIGFELWSKKKCKEELKKLGYSPCIKWYHGKYSARRLLLKKVYYTNVVQNLKDY